MTSSAEHPPPRPSWRDATTLAVLAASLWAAPTNAAESATTRASEEIFFQNVPVVLSATRLPQPVSETPAAITVIDREMIEASGAIEIPDLFRLVPGFQVGHANNASDGPITVVTYHGLSDRYARRMQVLVDGRSVYTPLFGGVQWNDLPLAIEDIERIEVIRGPNGVTYGANAFAAIINIITRDPQLDHGTHASVTRGDIGTRKALVRHGGETGKLNYRVTAAQQEDDGIIPTPDDKRSTLLTFRGDYRIDARDSLDIQLGYNTGPRGKGDGSNTNALREENVKSAFEQVRWRRVFSPDEELNLQLYHNYHHISDTYQTALLSAMLGAAPSYFGRPDQRLTVSGDTTSERLDLEFSHTLRPWRSLRLAWGSELRLDRVASEAWFGTDDYLSNRLRRLFANAEWKFAPDWILNAGAMYEHNSMTGGEVSPRLAINRHLNQHHTLRGGMTRAYRTPSLYEQRADTNFRFPDGGVIDRLYKTNTRITPEEITSYELGYHGEFPISHLSLDLRVYRDTIRNVIALASGDASVSDLVGNGGSTFRNEGHAEIGGADLQLEYRPSSRTRLFLAYAHANQEGRVRSKISPVEYSDTLHSTPTETTNLLVMHRFPRGFEGSLNYRIVTDMEFLGGGTEATRNYTTGDVRLARKFRAREHWGEFAVTVQNVTGAHFDFDDSATLDTRALFTLTLEFR